MVGGWSLSAPADSSLSLLQGPEFIHFLQQEYLPSLQVSPDISQVTTETHFCPRLRRTTLAAG